MVSANPLLEGVNMRVLRTTAHAFTIFLFCFIDLYYKFFLALRVDDDGL